MIVRIISIGSELVLGQTVDTNAAWLSRELAAVGVACVGHLTVGDDRAEIAEAIRTVAERSDMVLITGGLGPTPDDLTRASLADVLSTELRLHEPSLAAIEDYFRSRNRPMHEANRVQAMIPEGAEAIANRQGTAPGIRARVGEAEVIAMPGVPHEMKSMFRRDVLPGLRAAGGETAIVQRIVHTIGMSESEIGDKLADLMTPGRNPSVGTSAEELVISVRVNAAGDSAEQAERLAGDDAAVIRERLGRSVFGEDDDTLATAVGGLLIRRGLTVSVAESCTGGLIAKRLTDVPGSSAYFVQGFVTYSNAAKTRLLGVPTDLIEQCGAVSAEVAEAMALGCRRASATDYAVAVTGIAGPGGGTEAKPVGLVYAALATPDEVRVRELRLGQTLTRGQVRDRTGRIALNLLRLAIMGRPVHVREVPPGQGRAG